MSNFDGAQTTIAFGHGAVAGAAAPIMLVAGAGTLTVASVGFSLGASQKIMTDVVVNDETMLEATRDWDTVIAGGLGAFGGVASGSIPTELGGELAMDVGAYAYAVGGKQFGQRATSNLMWEQAAYFIGPEFALGATIGNTSSIEVAECGNMFSCAANSLSNWWTEASEEQ